MLPGHAAPEGHAEPLEQPWRPPPTQLQLRTALGLSQKSSSSASRLQAGGKQRAQALQGVHKTVADVLMDAFPSQRPNGLPNAQHRALGRMKVRYCDEVRTVAGELVRTEARGGKDQVWQLMQSVKHNLHVSSLGGGQVPQPVLNALLDKALIMTDALAEAAFTLIEAHFHQGKRVSWADAE